MEGDEAVRLGLRCAVVAGAEGLQHRLPERGAVELERIGLTELAPDLAALALAGTQLERAVQEADSLVELVASDCECSRATKPRERLAAQPFELCRLAGPGEVGVLGPGRLGVVVGEQRSMLVTALAEALEPARERGVEPRPSRPRNARVS